MNLYERLLEECDKNNVEVYIMEMENKGLYSDNIIWLNKKLNTVNDKASILGEELGHHYTSYGDIIDQTKVSSVKQEKRARTWAYEKLVPIEKIVEAHKNHIKNKYELAEFLEVTETFLDHALERYKEKYGLCVPIGNFIISLDPLGVTEWFDHKNF